MKENKKLTNYEKERLFNLTYLFREAVSNTLYIHDLENTIGYYHQSKNKSTNSFKKNLQKLDKSTGVKENDLAIISANSNLLESANQIHYKITPSPEILFPASGKDGADLKLIESLKFLESNKILKKFNCLTIISGDKIFYKYILQLSQKGYKVRSFSRKQTSSNVYENLSEHSYIDLYERKRKKRKKSSNTTHKRNDYNPQFEKLKDYVFEPKVA